MVLVNGQKYACERCIRGHRVTTCTHTDQPLILIKPKGRPSTQCSHCKEQRQKKNLHIKCTCSKHSPDSTKSGHDSSCPCYVTGKCSCQTKTKKSSSSASGSSAKEGSIDTGSSYSSPTQTPQSIPQPRPRLDNISSNDSFNESDSKTAASTNSNQSASLIPNDVFLNDANIKSWEMESPISSSNDKLQSLSSSINSTTNSNLPTKDRYSYFQNIQVGMDPLQNFRAVTPQSEAPNKKRYGEISIPMDEYIAPMNAMNNNLNSLLISVASPTAEKADLDFPNNASTNVNNNNAIGSNTNDLGNGNGSNTNSTTHISNSHDGSIKNQNSSVSLNANNYGNFSSGSNNNKNGAFGNTIDYQLDTSSSSLNNSYSRSSSRLVSPLLNENFSDIPMPMAGNGLLDLFNYNGVNSSLINMSNSLANNDATTSAATDATNVNNNGVKNSKASTYDAYKVDSVGLTSGSSGNSESHGPEGYFPLHALVGPSLSSNNYQNSSYNGNSDSNGNINLSKDVQQGEQLDKLQSDITGSSVNSFSGSLSYSNLNSHNSRYTSGGTNPNSSSKALSRNYTGGSNYSSHSLHHPGGASHNHHHNSHTHNNHFSPYPNPMSHSHHSLHSQTQSQPRRSNSFLSISSAQSIESLNSSNYNLNSPPASGDTNPQMLTVDQNDSNKLTNAKTNTTLMDDIYQTKTYTEGNDLRKSKSRLQSAPIVDDDFALLSPDSINNSQNLMKFQQMDLNNSLNSPSNNKDSSPNSLNTNNTPKSQLLQQQKYIQDYSINPPIPDSTTSNTSNKDDLIGDKIDEFLLFNQDQATEYFNDPSIFSSTNTNSNDYANISNVNNNINQNSNDSNKVEVENYNNLNFDDFNSFLQSPQDNP